MALTVNGQPREAPAGQTVAALLSVLELPRERVAVELNGAILPRDRYGETTLRDGDSLEIVQFIGGG